jgi:pre-mRNA-splicing factor SYF1
MNTVITIRDFTQIWDAYATFEDSLISAQTSAMETNDEPDSKTEQLRMDANYVPGEELLDFDLRIARYENLIERQPLLVNSVLLRQNPHNVHEWTKRAQLYIENAKMTVETYRQALQTVDPQV